MLDVLLPDADGVVLLSELRATVEGRAVPVLILSSESEVADRLRALRTGADAYVGKPYDTAYVLAKTQELIRQRYGAPATSSSVLLVDDSPTFRQAMADSLESAGYSVIAAESGEQGLRLAATHRPGAIIVDGVMPGIDGPTVIRRIRLDAALRGTPCVLLTGSTGAATELEALEAGADAFVRKDAEAEVLLARLGAAIRGATSATPDVASTLLGPKTILAVDDSPTYLDQITESLRGEGCEVVAARSGEEALDLLAVEKVDCILLDLIMPGLGGLETCRLIKESAVARDIPLLMLTGVEDRRTMVEALALGADDFISKSADPEVVKARVRAQLRRKQLDEADRRFREALLYREVEAAQARAALELATTRAALIEELERKNAELQAFAYSVSHDLRAPLRSISGFAEILSRNHASSLDAKGQDYLRRVGAAAERMGRLIDDLLHLSRVGAQQMSRRNVDLTELAARVVSDLRGRAPDRAVDVAIAQGLIAHGDPGLLAILLENLLGNAWKFTAEVAEPIVEVGVHRVRPETVYFVRDNGAGFDMRHAEGLFRPFQRLHPEQRFPGTGIGLATVHRIVERHGGKIWAESKPGAGATFFFTIGTTRTDSGGAN